MTAASDPAARPRVVTVDEAIGLVTEGTSAAEGESVLLADSLGRTLRSDLASLSDLPNTASSAMDGYACRARDTAHASPEVPLGLRVVGEAPAGHGYGGALGSGEAVAIYTGAPLPDGADAVVRREVVERRGDAAWLTAPADDGDVRRRAEQLLADVAYLHEGTLMTPRAVLLAAAMGHASVPVARRPRVLVVVTGDELVWPPDRPGRGQVFDANGPAAAALVALAGGEVLETRHVADDLDGLTNFLLGRAPDADLILTLGGVSVGRFDVVHQILHRHPEAELSFAGVLCRPGGPVSFGRFAGVPLLALPGNPVAAAITFQVLGLAWFHRRLGRSDPAPYQARVMARAAGPFRHASRKMGFWPATLGRDRVDGTEIVRAVDPDGPAGPDQLQRADVLAITRPGQAIAAGERIEVMALA